MRYICGVVGLWLSIQFGTCNSPISQESANVSGPTQVAQGNNKGEPRRYLFEKILEVNPTLRSISFGSDGTGFIGSSDQHVWVSNDAGATWNENRIDYGKTPKTIEGSEHGGWYDIVRSTITVSGAIHALAHLEEAGTVVFTSTNRGRTWKDNTFEFSTLNDITSSGTNVWIVGTVHSSPVVLKDTSQNDWRIIWKSDQHQYLEGIDFVDSSSGWVVGAKGLILRSVDGGRTWKPQTSPTQNNLRSVAFADSDHGFIVGDHGTILQTNDGGVTWLKRESGTQAELTKVVTLSSEEACVVGRNGVVLVTISAGKQWQPHQLGTAADVYALTAADKDYWIGVSNGMVFRSRAR